MGITSDRYGRGPTAGHPRKARRSTNKPQASGGINAPRCSQAPVRNSKTTKARQSNWTGGLLSALNGWLRGLDLNQRPSGYEPDELPDCSTPRHQLVCPQAPVPTSVGWAILATFGPPRATGWPCGPAGRGPGLSASRQRPKSRRSDRPAAAFLKHVNGFSRSAPAAMPGDDLLFQRLSVSTIGAVRFHGRVRDGIGWGTDAMATKQ